MHNITLAPDAEGRKALFAASLAILELQWSIKVSMAVLMALRFNKVFQTQVFSTMDLFSLTACH